jgi:glutamate--cysteine ligase
MPESLPSARVLREIQNVYDGSFLRFALAYSLRHRSALPSEPLPADQEDSFARMADASLKKQRMIEADDKLPFENYRRQYLSPDSLRTGR